MAFARNGQSNLTQIERKRELRIALGRRNSHATWRVAKLEESRVTTAFGFKSIYWKCGVIEPTWMRNVISAASYRPRVPSVHNVKGERPVHANGRMQAFRWLPGAEADAGDVFALGAGRVQRYSAPVHALRSRVISQNESIPRCLLCAKVTSCRP